VGAAAYALTDASLILSIWQNFSVWNEIKVSILKLRQQIKNLTSSTDAYLCEEHSRQISSRHDLKQWSIRLFHEMMLWPPP